MFAMSQHTYAYPALPAASPVPPRQYSGHATSSAFSSSANPDEDWTKISDLAERRRIQNRIAQRNYRKKLKRRLEDLERRAGKSDGASSSGGEKSSPAGKNSASSKRSSPQTASKVSQKTSSQPASATTPTPQKHVQQPFTPPMHDEEYSYPHSLYDGRERSHTPPMFSYSTYPPPPEDVLLPPYSGAQPYRAVTAEFPPDYMTATAVPVTLPPMNHFNEAIKREHAYPGPEDTVYVPYHGFLSGMDIAGAPAPYDVSHPHTPPLSHSFDHSASCSDSGSFEAYPTTPLSMPGSPFMVSQQP